MDGGASSGSQVHDTERGVVFSIHKEADARARLEMTVHDILKILKADGWFLVVTRGSHRQFKHRIKPGRVTVAGKPSDDLPPGTLNSI